jgi:acyl-CoA synthetase (AMP-forming)/AMP-acid ligase II
MRELSVTKQRYQAVPAVIDDGRTVTEVAKDWLVIRGGFNVFPRDVEDALLEHPHAALAGGVGRPDKRSGEEVVAFVSLKTGSKVGEEELVEFAKSRVGAYKYPIEVQMDLVPLTPVGKVDRRALRQTAVWITIIPVARGLPQALAAVRDCASTAWFCV